MLTHLSLFSGIGGMDLAAEWAGIETVGQCEWADYPTKVLEKHWPDIARWRDIRTLTGESFYEKTGRRTVDIISGGFPCQPFSVAGKQRGKEDDRYLWPEMVRVIKELRPSWIVGENVTGIIRMALPDILSELEACGYRTRVFHIPASGVGARHHRYRVAIVGYAEHNGLSSAEITRGAKEAAGEFEGTGESGNSNGMGGTSYVENTDCSRCEQPKNVCQQPGGTKLKRAGQDLANTKSKFTGGLSVGKSEEKSRLSGGCKNVPYPYGTGCQEQYIATEPDQQRFSGRGCDAGNVCHSTGEGLPDRTGEPGGGQTQEQEFERSDSNVSNTDNRSRLMWGDGKLSTATASGGRRCNNGNGKEEHEPGERRPAESFLGRMADGASSWMDGDIDYMVNHYWDIEPDIPKIATGIDHRVDRLKALGNMVVPQWAYPIFKAISEIGVN